MGREAETTIAIENITEHQNPSRTLYQTNAIVLEVARATLVEESLRGVRTMPYTKDFQYWGGFSRNENSSLVSQAANPIVIFESNTGAEKADDSLIEASDEVLLEAAVVTGEICQIQAVEQEEEITAEFLPFLETFFKQRESLRRKHEEYLLQKKQTQSKDEQVSILRRYKQEVGRIPLLTDAHDVIVLAKGIEMGKNETQKRIEEQDPVIIAAGKRAFQELVAANLRLVLEYVFHNCETDLMEDAIQYGNDGLMEAAKRYDRKRGFAFSSYAMYWIRGAISRGFANNEETIRLPVYLVEMISKISHMTQTLQQKLHREPTAAELARELEISTERLKKIKGSIKEKISLSVPLSEERKDNARIDLIEDETATDEMNAVSQGGLSDQLSIIFEKVLTKRQQELVRYRYLDMEGRHSMKEVCAKFQISRSAAQQIFAFAFRRLRTTPEGAVLADYLRP